MSMISRNAIVITLLGGLGACASPEAPSLPVDAGATVDSGTTSAPEAGTLDAATAQDAGLVNPCPETATLEMTESSLVWDWWLGDELPQAQLALVVSDPLCTELSVSTNAAWLVAGADTATNSLFIRLKSEAVVSGLHEGLIELRTAPDRPVLATVQVELKALTHARGEGRPHVLVIGMDGVRADALRLADTPQIDALAARGTSSYTASTQLSARTASAAGWHSIFTGAEPRKHGVTVNGYYRQLDRDYPTFFQRAARDLELRAAVSAHWAPILDQHIEEDALHFGSRGTDQEVTDAMAEHLRSGESQVHFVHLDDVDHSGHASGFDPYNERYLRAIRGNDVMVGTLVSAILDRPDVADENWLVIWVTDHGGSGRDHGDQIVSHQRIALITSGPSAIRRPVEGGNHMDVHPTVMQHLGLSPDESWDLDGSIFGLPLLTEANCSDGRDDDQDGQIDCDDPDCSDAEACLPIGDICPSERVGQRLEWAIYTAGMQGAVARLSGSCGGLEGRERTLLWQAPHTSRYTFNTISSRGNTVLWARSECEGQELACNDELYGDARMDVPYNTQSLIQLDLNQGQRIILGLDEAARNRVDQVTLNVYDLGLACSEAGTLSQVGMAVARGNNDAQATRLTPSCAGMGRDHIILWTAPASATYRFDTQGSGLDTVLALYSNDCLNELACNDDGGQGYTSVVEYAVNEGDQVAIVVGGFRGRNGLWELNITELD